MLFPEESVVSFIRFSKGSGPTRFLRTPAVGIDLKDEVWVQLLHFTVQESVCREGGISLRGMQLLCDSDTVWTRSYASGLC